ncbi:MAG: hypothetical protein GEU79_14275 [Acidimicrobiia bacterium]|nr:hypothetical protein [Acidimicrobiia bacterium]
MRLSSLRRCAVALLAVVAIFSTGCGVSTEDGQSSGMGVESALGMQSSESLTVTGFAVIFENGEVVLADELVNGAPPEPDDITMEVRGLDEDAVTWESGNGVRWTEKPIRVTGTISNGVLTANATKGE